MKKILKNLLVAIGIISYFMILVLANNRMNTERLANDIKVFAGAFLVVAILVIEKAYKKDSGKIAITSIELLVLAFHSLSIIHMVNILKCDFNFYLITSAVVVASYYIIKGIIIYTMDRKEYLRGLSDISEIVKEDEPIKKEAKKRNTQEPEKAKEIIDDNKKENVEIKKQVNTKKKTTTKKTTQTKKTTSTKKTTAGSKKESTKKTVQPEKNEEKVQTKRKTTKKTIAVGETKTENKPKTAKKRTTNKDKEVETTAETPKKKKTSTTTTAKKTTKKSEKEVKEND